MKRFFITLALCMAFVGLAQAQLSQGETYSSKIITGNRPESGDWGLYFGPSYSEVIDYINTWGSQTESAIGLPLINLKYYASDRAELRIGLQYNGHTSKTDGTFTVNYDDVYPFYEEDFGSRDITLTSTEDSASALVLPTTSPPRMYSMCMSVSPSLLALIQKGKYMKPLIIKYSPTSKATSTAFKKSM